MIDIPPRIARLPKDARGYPIPYFVAYVNGVPDFRVLDREKVSSALRDALCMVCGERLGRFKAFLIGPMCAINRVSAEPPLHRECAIFSARSCPFLSNPKQVRRKTALPDHEQPAGVMLERNPGVSLVWVTTAFKTVLDPNGGKLFRIGDPEEWLWFSEGRTATREEVAASIESGLPVLRKAAEEESPEAVAALEGMCLAVVEFLP